MLLVCKPSLLSFMASKNQKEVSYLVIGMLNGRCAVNGEAVVAMRRAVEAGV